MTALCLLLSLSLLSLAWSECPAQCQCEDHSTVSVTCLTAQMETFPNTLNPQLEEIVIRQTDIAQVDSAFLWFFPELVSVDLSENSVSRVLEKTWVHNVKLERISLAHNKIELMPDLLGLASLTSLNLSYNALQTLPEDVVKTKLEVVDLSSNLVTSLPPLPSSLQVLNVSHNKISWLSDALAELPELLHLDLSDNPLLSVLPSDLSLAPSLLSLSLASTGLRTVPGEALLEVGGLLHLDLSHNNFTVLPSHALAGLPRLESLAVSHCPLLQRVETGVFSPDLSSLDLSHNPRLSSLQSDSLVGLARLQRLLIQGNNLSSAVVPPSLQSLRAENNPWLCDCDLLQLQRSLARLSNLSPAVCHLPAKYRGQDVLQVSLQHCRQGRHSGRHREQEEERSNYLYFYCIVSAGCCTILLLVLIFSRKHLIRAVTKSRKTDEKSQDTGCEKSFIQYDEYFLSLARYQAEMENIPVTEL